MRNPRLKKTGKKAIGTQLWQQTYLSSVGEPTSAESGSESFLRSAAGTSVYEIFTAYEGEQGRKCMSQ